MFCERILMDFKIIGDLQRLLQNGWTWICFHGSLSISSSANPCWICVVKMDRYWSPLDDPCSNLSIWMSVGMVHPSSFLILVGWFCHLACNTNQILCDFPTCEGHYIFWTLNSAWEDSVFSFLTILVLEDTRVHVCSTDSCNKLANIEAPINKHFSTAPTLDIPNIDPHNDHIGLGWHLDYSRFGYKRHVIKNLVLF